MKKGEWSTVNTQYCNSTQAVVCKIYQLFQLKKVTAEGDHKILVFLATRAEPEFKFLTEFIHITTFKPDTFKWTH